MKIEELSPFSFASFDPIRGGMIASQNNLEKFLISLIAFFGIIGSVYIIASSSMAEQPAPIENLVFFSPTLLSNLEEDSVLAKDEMSKYLDITGNYSSGSPLHFKFIGKREEGYRYMLEMGDEMRVMFRSDYYRHTYEKPGKYTLELKKTKNAIVTTIAKKTITIK